MLQANKFRVLKVLSNDRIRLILSGGAVLKLSARPFQNID